eukprot:gene11649-11794_t
MTGSVTHYQLLGVCQTAPEQDIKAAYQKLALQWHPDKTSGAEDKFHQLQEAWLTLRSAQSRAMYDHQLSQAELKATVVLHDELNLDDMEQLQEPVMADTNTEPTCQYCYPCRCGDSFSLTAADINLTSGEIIIPCRLGRFLLHASSALNNCQGHHLLASTLLALTGPSASHFVWSLASGFSGTGEDRLLLVDHSSAVLISAS